MATLVFASGAMGWNAFRSCRHRLPMRLLILQNAKVSVKAEDNLHRRRVRFNTSAGDEIVVDAVFQDTLPSGSQIGAVLAIHGAPGSHKDFKYIAPLLEKKAIRFIGVNMPGFGLTPGDPRLLCDNVERNSFINGLISKIDNIERLVVIGHSRGCENALAVGVSNKDKLLGVVLANPTGFLIHQAMRPWWITTSVLWLYSLGSVARSIMHPIMKFFYNYVLGLRLDTGERAMMCVRTMSKLEFEKGMRPLVNAINLIEKSRVLIAYAGKDKLVETSVSENFASSFKDHRALCCADRKDSSEEKAISETRDLFRNGIKTISIYFKEDGHFLQRDRARYIAECIEAILRS